MTLGEGTSLIAEAMPGALGLPSAFDAWHLEQLQKELTLKHLDQARHDQDDRGAIRSPLPSVRRTLVIKLAPPAPPCFHDRLTWLEYLVEAQASLKGGSERGPLDMRSGVPQFNHELDYCADCSARHAMAMQKARRCNPEHLRALAPSLSTAS